MNESLLHALDDVMTGDWEGAKEALEPLDDPLAQYLFMVIARLESRENAARRASVMLRHEIGNALSIVQANLEGIIDGVLDASPERLAAVHEALTNAGALLEDLRHSTTDPTHAHP